MKSKVRIGEVEVSLNDRLVSLFAGHGPKCYEYRKTFRDGKSAEEYYFSVISRMRAGKVKA